jgi:hypothetical protein
LGPRKAEKPFLDPCRLDEDISSASPQLNLLNFLHRSIHLSDLNDDSYDRNSSTGGQGPYPSPHECTSASPGHPLSRQRTNPLRFMIQMFEVAHYRWATESSRYRQLWSCNATKLFHLLSLLTTLSVEFSIPTHPLALRRAQHRIRLRIYSREPLSKQEDTSRASRARGHTSIGYATPKRIISRS